MRICLILSVLFNSTFLLGKSSEFGSGTIATNGDSTVVFKPQRELYFSCFSPFPDFPKYNDGFWHYMLEINYSKSLNKWLTINHNLFFLGGIREYSGINYFRGGEFYEFTLSHSLKLNKKGTFRFDFAYGVFAGDYRVTNRSYYAPPPVYSGVEDLIYFGAGPVFKGKLRYNFSDKFGVSISSNLRTYFGFATTKDMYHLHGYEFSIYPLWQYLQIGVDIKLNQKK